MKTDIKKKRLLAQALIAKELEACAHPITGPERFIFGHVQTKDEHSRSNPVKQFPRKAYLVATLNEWHTGPYIQYVAKSRQLMISWLLCAYAIWMARFNPHALVLFQSKKEKDAQLMVYYKDLNQARCSFMEKHLPHWLKVCKSDEERGESRWLPIDLNEACAKGAIQYPNGGRVEAIPQGAMQIEGRVPALFLNDEASLQDEWSMAQAAALPCLTGTTEEDNAKGITVATMRLPSDYGVEVMTAQDVDPDGIMRGMAHFTSASGVPGIRIHYSADPAKDPSTEAGKKWLEAFVAGYPDGMGGHLWQQHMEINPLARSGERCVPYWYEIESKVVIPPVPLESQMGWSYDAGLDWGTRNNAVIQVFGNNPDNDRYMLYEIARPGREMGGIVGFCKRIREIPVFERINGRIHADPSLWNKDQNMSGGLKSRAQIFQEEGVYLRMAVAKGQEADEITLERINNFYWASRDDDYFEPRLYIVETCRGFIDEVGLWRYEEWADALAGDRAYHEKMHNYKVDSFDAFKYCEVARPSPASAVRRPPPGSFSAIRQSILANNRPTGRKSV